ncbi:MAG: peptide ABC transporter substrate-binding protein [Peptococcaceae bacterium]|nr:peptide ABC transporter substrate-binding protein [Peptococcaceae bacterium]
MPWKKVVGLLAIMAVFAFVFILAGCGGGQEESTGTASGEMAEEQVLIHNIGTEPESLDPAKITGIPEGTAVYQLFEGLTRITEDGLKPAVAESWDVSPDGLTYTFHLRDGAKWNNGDPVTAYDFEYAWKRALNPETECEYAYQLYYVKNGEAYNAGEITDPDQVGVKALDEKTLEVTLEAPAPYFLSLTSFYTLYPVHKATVEANPDWANAPETFVSNGPFNLENWEHHSKLELVKNDTYWDAENVKLDKVILTMVEEQATYLTMWENGEIDTIESPPLADMDRLRAEGKLQTKPYLGVYYYIFNTEQEPFDDPKVRKALALAIDRKTIVEKITKGGQLPAFALVPPGIPDAEPGSDFREVGGDLFKEDVETAKQLLAEAGYPNGEGLPEITILYNTHEAHKTIAEAIQEMWKTNLGIENVKLTNQEWKVYLNSRDEGDFHVARAGWIGDYADPMTFVDMFVTGGSQNDGRWSNARYDELVETAKNTGDQKVRMEAMHEAEEILMDEMAVMPIYFYTLNVCEQDYVRDVFWDPLGPPHFKSAWIAKH